jgi:hypothetical protein
MGRNVISIGVDMFSMPGVAVAVVAFDKNHEI